jgi:decaprenylphospho-beta-D-ribofuranose 2-oxidase
VNTVQKYLSGFANYPKTRGVVIQPHHLSQLHFPSMPYIPRGQGKSYGDTALPSNGGAIISTKYLNHILAFDEKTGIVQAESGTNFSDLIQAFLPRGFFPNVVPGTQYVSLGGALASDIHGKNHHRIGSFSAHVPQFELITPDITKHICTLSTDLYRYTVGGQGLTGLISKLHLQLQPVETAFIKTHYEAAPSLESLFLKLEQTQHASYQVAWLDGFARGATLGKGILITGEHARREELSPKINNFFTIPKQTIKTVPRFFPHFLLNQNTLSLHNAWYYAQHQKKTGLQFIDYQKFFFPLDNLNCWPRFYSKIGFIQYQVVFPIDKAFSGIKQLLETLHREKHFPYLCVLKLFGKANDSPLSFPMEGYTLALDLPLDKTYHLLPVLEKLDRITLEHQGRVYLTKDARLSKENFQAMYPEEKKFQSFKKQIDPNNMSISPFFPFRINTMNVKKENASQQKTIVILGATSTIAQHLAAEFSKHADFLYLGGRDKMALEHIATDLQYRHQIHTAIGIFDASDPSTQDTFFKNCIENSPHIIGVILAHGYLGDQKLAQTDFEETQRIIQINFLSAVYLLDKFSQYFKQRQLGFIIALSSVAGDRGRQSNYYYGTAKGALTLYLQGLRNSLHPFHVHVMTVKLGFVDTKMTHGLPGLFLVANPKDIAKQILQAWKKKKDTLYLPGFWRWIMLIIKMIPEKIFKRLSL